jgi:metal-dependent hydrolase (beta-lactamase superfamily II)
MKISVLTEQSLDLKTDKGVIVVTGCSHAGVVNIAEHVKKYGAGDIFEVET